MTGIDASININHRVNRLLIVLKYDVNPNPRMRNGFSSMIASYFGTGSSNFRRNDALRPNKKGFLFFLRRQQQQYYKNGQTFSIGVSLSLCLSSMISRAKFIYFFVSTLFSPFFFTSPSFSSSRGSLTYSTLLYIFINLFFKIYYIRYYLNQIL